MNVENKYVSTNVQGGHRQAGGANGSGWCIGAARGQVEGANKLVGWGKQTRGMNEWVYEQVMSGGHMGMNESDGGSEWTGVGT